MPYQPGNPTGLLGSTEFVLSIYEELTSKAYEAKYPEILWSETIPLESIDRTINPGATVASYTVKDMTGVGAFRSDTGPDAPQVGLSMDKVPVTIETGHVGATISRDDARAIQMGYSGMNLATEKTEAMRRACERHIERVFFYGQGSLGYEGYIDYPYVPVGTASTKAAGGTEWIGNATPEEILTDISNAIEKVYGDSKGVYLPGYIEMPLGQYIYINSTRLNGVSGDGVNQTIANYLKTNNIFSVKTGEELTIVGNRHLEGAGVSDTDRLVISEKKPENHWFPYPESFILLPPEQRGADTYLTGVYRFGSYHKPHPASTFYLDGI